jgi:hypothetical protein
MDKRRLRGMSRTAAQRAGDRKRRKTGGTDDTALGLVIGAICLIILI